MTEERLKEIEDSNEWMADYGFKRASIAELIAEVRRLQILVKGLERYRDLSNEQISELNSLVERAKRFAHVAAQEANFSGTEEAAKQWLKDAK